MSTETSINPERIPPNDTAAERALLGAIMLDAAGSGEDRVWDLCLTRDIVEDSFYDDRHKTVFATMRELARQSKPVDLLTVTSELQRKRRLKAIGGGAYLQNIADSTPTVAHAEYYISLVRDKHLRRMMIDRATATIHKCYDADDYPDPQAVLGDAEKSFLEIGMKNTDTMPWHDAIQLSFERLNAMFETNGSKLDGLSTGLTHLDERLRGLKPGEMIVIAARPSVGKTSLAMNIAECAALGEDMNGNRTKTDNGKQHPVMIFSLEMPVEALAQRMIAGRAKMNVWKVSRALCSASEKKNLTTSLFQSLDKLKSAPIIVDDAAGLDIMDLRARARRAKKAHGIELIVIDYLQLCKCADKARQSRVIEVTEISQQIKAMAKELKIPVIVLSQLSRANEQRGDKFEKPKLSDLRDSGAIEQDADVVFLLRRPSRTPSDPESNDQNLAIIDVAKNRNGEIGEVKVNFYREFVRFGDRPIEHKEEDNFTTSEPEPAPTQATLDYGDMTS